MLIIFAILIPIILGIALPFLKPEKKLRDVYVILVAIFTSLIIFWTIIKNINVDMTFVRLNDVLSIGFRIDGLSKIFLMIVGLLWPLAVIYATEYMEHEKNQNEFFRYYLIAYGITIGVATSRNLISMYLFYELLTFLTLPLIMHKGNKESLYAGKIYLIFSLLGASIALMGIIIFIANVGNIEFTYGGLVTGITNLNNNVLYLAYILCFIGFGVKAAILPFTIWLPLCGVAPTPVSALLHAVAVVKAGVFAVMRVTYYIFGASFLRGTYASTITSIIAIVTILFGSTMAVRDKHIKRRLAYSTASNLSYILFVVTLMTDETFAAGLTHMMSHAIIKINLFFAAGSIMIYAKRDNIDDMKGLAKKMPITSFAFLIASLALIGIPLTCGFISKFALITSAISAGTFEAYIGIVAIVISAILTLIYLFNIVLNLYVPNAGFDYNSISDVREAGMAIKVVLIIITILIIYFGINSIGMIDFIDSVAKGVI